MISNRILKGQFSDANAEVTENLVTRQRLQSSHNKITKKRKSQELIALANNGLPI